MYFIRFFITLLVFNLLTPLTSFARTSAEGGSVGGGGSQEARMFMAVAVAKAKTFLYQPGKERYARQLLETLTEKPIEIILVESLDGRCDGLAEPTFYAYSCFEEVKGPSGARRSGRIYLLNSFWSNKAQSRLRTRASANAHWQDFIHEVFRASDPNSPNYITDDSGYQVSQALALPPTMNPQAEKICKKMATAHPSQTDSCFRLTSGKWFQPEALNICEKMAEEVYRQQVCLIEVQNRYFEIPSLRICSGHVGRGENGNLQANECLKAIKLPDYLFW